MWNEPIKFDIVAFPNISGAYSYYFVFWRKGEVTQLLLLPFNAYIKVFYRCVNGAIIGKRKCAKDMHCNATDLASIGNTEIVRPPFSPP